MLSRPLSALPGAYMTMLRAVAMQDTMEMVFHAFHVQNVLPMPSSCHSALLEADLTTWYAAASLDTTATTLLALSARRAAPTQHCQVRAEQGAGGTLSSAPATLASSAADLQPVQDVLVTP